jgi:hypothetical protein
MRPAIAVLSSDLDVHAAAVVWGLLRKGIEARLVSMAKCVGFGGVTVNLAANKAPHVFIRADTETFDLLDFQGFWLRRAFNLPLSLEALHKDDRAIAELEWREYLRSIYLILAAQGRYCLNRPRTKDFELAKPFQLLAAMELGLRIPDSAIGNDVERVRQTFARLHSVVYKTLSPNVWTQVDLPGAARALPTTVLPLAGPAWRDFSLSPGIVQQYIDKKYEVRVTVIGSELVAVGIDSQSEETSRIDWRTASTYSRPNVFFPIQTTPRAIRRKLMTYCERMDLDFCTFDFIVTPEDDWVFLEANQSGQFLFCEYALPETRLLDRLCNFLARRIGVRPHATTLSYADFWQSVDGQGFYERWRESQK